MPVTKKRKMDFDEKESLKRIKYTLIMQHLMCLNKQCICYYLAEPFKLCSAR